jgi:Cu/Ag efflux protein CusF
MRLYKVVILLNLALSVGFLVGSLWWAEELARLRQELSAARQALKAQPAAEQRGTAQGFVRGVSPQKKLLFLTHEDIPGLMPSMTMGFRTEDPSLTRGLLAGDQVRFTVQKTGEGFTLIALRKER